MTPRLAVAAAMTLAGCADPLPVHPAGTPVPAWAVAGPQDGVFTMTDGALLPYRDWLPPDGLPPNGLAPNGLAPNGLAPNGLPPNGLARTQPWAVVLALHGMNDSRDAWEIPAPALAQAGIAVFAPDQRGFGAAPARGHFPAVATLTDDAATMVRALRRRYPQARLILLGESMGGAVLMCLTARPDAPRVDGYVLVSPAVWGRDEMNPFLRVGLWVMAGAFPGLTNTGSIAHVTASDNRAALVRLSNDPLTIHATRFDAVRGLVDLMDAAQAAAPSMPAPALFLYGGRDELIPRRATAAIWRALPAGVRQAYYPTGYHLLLRDSDRAKALADVAQWIADPAAPLPSGADLAAHAWLATQP